MGQVIWNETTLTSRIAWEGRAHRGKEVRGKGVFTFPLGPVRADVAEAVHYRLAVMGDEILRLDVVNGLKIRHVLQKATGHKVSRALSYIERITGTSPVAHAWAFCMAVESTNGELLPSDVHWSRSILAELERVMSHLGDLAALSVSTGLPIPQMMYWHVKERVLRMMERLVGHRYGRGAIVPGGLFGRTLSLLDLSDLVDEVMRWQVEIQKVRRTLEHTPSFLDRLVGAGQIPHSTLEFVRPVGPIGRAAGSSLDVRQFRSYGAYQRFPIPVATYSDRDARARFEVKADELAASVEWLKHYLWRWKPWVGPGNLDARTGGLGMVEAPRGQLIYQLHVAVGVVQDIALTTPSQRNWYVVAPAMQNHNIMQDFPIIDASFNLSVAGWDQ